MRIIEEARGLIARGHDVCIAAPPQSRIYAEARRYGVTAHALPIARKGLRGLLALRRFLAGRHFDIVNSHSSTDSWLAALALQTLPRAPRLVRTRHISAPIARNVATRWLYGCATARVVTTGERLREQVVRETRIDPDRVTSIRTGIDLARFVPGESSTICISRSTRGSQPSAGQASVKHPSDHRHGEICLKAECEKVLSPRR